MSEITRIRSNMGAMQSLRALQDVNNKLANTQLRLASGYKINTVGDNPAGYSLGKSLEARMRGLNVAMDNVADAKNVLGIANSTMRPGSEIGDELIGARHGDIGK